MARRDASNGAVHYYFSDHLNSTDMVTDALGTMSTCTGYSLPTGEEESDYYPFGGERVVCDRGIGNNYKFTGKERDSETGFDEFGARYYSSAMGRFTTADWAAKPTAVPYAKFGDPQTLNLYSYVENAPVNRADRDGHDGPVQTFFNELLAPLFAARNGDSGPSDDQAPGPPHVVPAHDVVSKSADAVGQGTTIMSNAVSAADVTGMGNAAQEMMQGNYGKAALAVPLALAGGPESIETHHLLPQAFKGQFERVGLNIEQFTVKMSRADHRLNPGACTQYWAAIGMGAGKPSLTQIRRRPANRYSPF